MIKEDEILEALQEASGIAWDTCHKIYILMDDEQMDKMASYDYDPLVYAKNTSIEDMKALIHEWWIESCGLRFIESVSTRGGEDGEASFRSIIAQGEGYEDEVCDDCDNGTDQPCDRCSAEYAATGRRGDNAY